MKPNRFFQTAAVIALLWPGPDGVAQVEATSPKRFTNCLSIATPNAATLSVRKAVNREKQPLHQGDEIAAFDGLGTCMGAAVWKTNTGNALRVQGADALFAIPGFSPGDSMRFRIWDAAAEREFHAEPTWISPDQHNGNFVPGSFFIVELEAAQPLPVELVRFIGYADGPVVVLNWETASESANAGFEVQHSLNKTDFELLGFVAGSGTSAEAHRYELRTPVLSEGVHYFRLKQIDFDGMTAYSPVVEVIRTLGSRAALSEVFPNPGGIRLSFTMAAESDEDVQVTLYDVLGRPIAALFDGRIHAGESRKVEVEAAKFPSGLYVLVMETSSGYRAARSLTIAR